MPVIVTLVLGTLGAWFAGSLGNWTTSTAGLRPSPSDWQRCSC